MDPIVCDLGTRFSILGTRIGSLKHLKKFLKYTLLGKLKLCQVSNDKKAGKYHSTSTALARESRPPKFLEHLVILCFERGYPKQYSASRLKSKIPPPNLLAPPKILGWLRHCLRVRC